MEIKIESLRFEVENNASVTLCPFIKNDIYIGSYACREMCEYFEGANLNNKTIFCSFKGE